MKIIDSKGRLFGKLSILDLGAAGVILLVVVGVFFSPGTPWTNNIVAQAKMKPIEVQVLVRGLSVGDFDSLEKEFQEEKKTDIVIRNQPAGSVELVSAKVLPRTTPVPQPDGTVKALPDPRPEVAMIKDMIVTFNSRAEVNKNGIVLAGAKKVKIGTSIQLQGNIYDFSGTIIAVNVKQ